jgi:hypothetical protein
VCLLGIPSWIGVLRLGSGCERPLVSGASLVVTRPEGDPASVRLDFVLLARLQQIAQGEVTTEDELRSLWERADAWARMLGGQIEGSERRLRQLAERESPPLGEISSEVRRLEVLQPRLDEVRSLLAELEQLVG